MNEFVRLTILCVLLLIRQQAVAEVPSELVVGVPHSASDEGLVAGMGVAQRLVRAAISDPLLVPKVGIAADQALFTLILVDSFQVDPALTTWSYRIRDGVVFSNGQQLRAVDACDSLRRCPRDASSEQFSLVECVVRSSQVGESFREWIDLKFDVSLNTKALQRAAINFLASCPVLEAHSRKLFGADYGVGSNMLGAGEFRLTGFQQGKSYRLERFQRDRAMLAPAPQTVEILTFGAMKEALTALRVGSIGMFVNTDVDIATTAASDQTLRVKDCAGIQVIYRRGYDFGCAEGIKLSSVIWNLAAVSEGLQ